MKSCIACIAIMFTSMIQVAGQETVTLANLDDRVLALARSLNAASMEERRAASSELLRIGQVAAPTLLRALEHDNADDRMSAAQGLELFDQWMAPLAVPALLNVMDDPKPKVRAAAAKALGAVGRNSKAVMPALIEAMSDKEPEVRSSALRSLGAVELETEEALPSVIAALADEEADVRVSAAYALCSVGFETRKESISALVRLTDDESDVVRATALNAMANLGNTEDLEPVLHLLTRALPDSNASVRAQAAYSLSYVGGEDVTQLLIAAMDDSDAQVRASVAHCLGNRRAKAAVPVLIEALDDEEQEVRLGAMYSLGWIGSADALPALVKVLSNPERKERSRAVEALGRLGRQEAVPYLLDLLDVDNRWHTRGVLLAFEQLGSAAISAAPTLVGIIRDRESGRDNRRLAVKSLLEISGSCIEKMQELSTEELDELISHLAEAESCGTPDSKTMSRYRMALQAERRFR